MSTKFVLVGVPGIGKTELATAIAGEIGGSVMGSAPSILSDAAFGALMDYRDEILLASIRTQLHLLKPNDPSVFDGSLFDSFAHVSINLERMAKYQNVSEQTMERTVLAGALIGSMMTDSVEQDYVFFLERELEPDLDNEEYLLQNRLRTILDAWQVDYMILREEEKGDWETQAKETVKLYG